MTTEYAMALEAHNVACRIFAGYQSAYRGRKIGDDEFIQARKAYDAATTIYDAAYAAEERVNEGSE